MAKKRNKRKAKNHREKPGPKNKVGPDQKKQALAVLMVGGSRKDAARVLAINYSTLKRAWKADPQFAHGLRQAETKGKMHHLKKLFDTNAWGAHAFYLERKYPKEFAKRDRLDVTSGGEVIKGYVNIDVEKV